MLYHHYIRNTSTLCIVLLNDFIMFNIGNIMIFSLHAITMSLLLILVIIAITIIIMHTTIIILLLLLFRQNYYISFANILRKRVVGTITE